MELYEYEVGAAEAGSEAGLEGGLKAELNRLGAQGWELATSFALPHLGRSKLAHLGIATPTVLIHKRPLRATREVPK